MLIKWLVVNWDGVNFIHAIWDWARLVFMITVSRNNWDCQHQKSILGRKRELWKWENDRF